MIRDYRKIFSTIFIVLFSIILFINNIQAQNLNFPKVMQRTDDSIIIDGIVDEEAWQKIQPLQMISHWPEFGNAPTDHTEIRVTYDDDYIYISGTFNVSPENILAASFKRDLFTLGTDYLAIVLDTFNDNENALFFGTTPTGNRSDQAISEDAAQRNSSWDTFWDAESYQDENGWSAEIRIPWSSMGFQVIDNKVTMGMIAWCYTAKKNEMNIFPTVRPDFGFWSFVKPSQMQKVVFENIKSSNPVYITPYALAGTGQEFVLKDDSSGYRGKNDLTKSFGLDVKYNVTDNLTLDFSVNTDFAQVEADDQQVNLTRFSLFFPEKRRFFLERASIFDFSFGGYNRLFYTRRIGLQGGEPVNIIGGARLAGRIGDWDIGVLDVQTEGNNGLLAENFGVLRLKKHVINSYSYVGGMFTNRLDEDGNYNLGYGVDGVIRLFGHDYLSFNLAQTYDNSSDSNFDIGKTLRGRVVWERRSYKDFAYEFALESAGKDYNPVMGFEYRDDFSHLNTELSYGWVFKGHPLFQRHRVEIGTDVYKRNSDGSIETIEISPKWEGAFVFGGSFWMGLNAVQEDLIEGFSLADDIEILYGKHKYFNGYIGFDTPGGNELSGWIDIGYGSFFDGRKFSLSLGSKWIASKYFELNGSYDYHKIEFEDRNQSLETHVLQIRSLLALNTKFSLASFIQYNSSANISLANIRFRYNPREGSDLYIVYNEQFNSDRRREIPVLPVSRNRTILAKYTYTFAF